MPRPTPLALCLSLSLLGLATTCPAAETPQQAETETRAAVHERSQDAAIGIERQVPPGQVQSLQAGEESFLALWLPANAPQAAGVVILVPGEGESADWPVAIGPLRRRLPDAGWQTLSLSLPDPQGTAAMPRPVAVADAPASAKPAENAVGGDKAESTTADQPAAEESAPPVDAIERRKAYAERVLARIQASVDQALQHKPQQVVLLGHGSGAYWAARYLAERQPEGINNLLLVAAQVPRDFHPALEDMLPELKLTTGDFYYRDQDSARDAARLRLQNSRRAQHPGYVQIALNAIPADREGEQEQLFRRIRGWLSSHVAKSGGNH